MVDPGLVRLLCCPETHQDVREADPGLVRDLNARIAAGALKNRAGQVVRVKLDGGLVRSDGQWLYPMRQDIPVMLVDEAIPIPNAPGLSGAAH